MPVGNIDPRTDTLTLTGMKLGSEEYPSTIQQAESENTGYLLYKPYSIWNGYHGKANSGGVPETVTMATRALLLAGDYDFYASCTSANGTGRVAIDGTNVVSSVYDTTDTGTLASFNVSSTGWYNVTAVILIDATSTGEIAWNLFARQYA